MFENDAPLFGVRDVHKSYDNRPVLKGLDLDLFSADFTLLLGANGSGKSTFLRLCAGLVRPEGGSCFCAEADIASGPLWRPPPSALCAHAGHHLHLYSLLSVEENLSITRALLCPAVSVRDYLKLWQLEDAASRLVGQLSRGQQYRVSIARALMHAPKLILLDEPTSSLDDPSLGLLLRFLEQLRENTGSSILIATHDLGRLAPFASRILVLEDGRIMKDSRALQKGEQLSPAFSRQKCLEYYRERNR